MAESGGTISKDRVMKVGGALALLLLLLVAWQLFTAYQARQERDEARQQLVFQRMATDLAMGAIEASYGSYEGARELTSSFFTRLQQNVGRLPAETREQANVILSQRDGVITALSRRDPESPEILARMFFRYRRALGEPDRAEFIPGFGTDPAAGPDTAPAQAPPDTLQR